MTSAELPSIPTRSHAVDVGPVKLYAECRGDGPDVLLIAGLGDPVEAWEPQLDGLSDRYRLTAYDNRGMGRSPLPADPFTVATLADDAASVLRAGGARTAHVAGFSGGSVIAQELALSHPDLVRSLVLVSTWSQFDAYAERMVGFWRWLAEAADERSFLECFFLWIYTRRAHSDGTVDQIIEEALAFPHKASPEAMHRFIDAFVAYEGTADRLNDIAVPTMVVAGEEDICTPPFMGAAVAEGIPGARFELMEEEAHQPFQEVPDAFNALVDGFWQEVDGNA